MNKGKILVVGDNNGIRATLKLLLTKYFKEVRLASTPNVINAELRDFAPDVVLLDMNFVSSANTGNEGLFWLSEIKKSKPETEVVLFTAYADISLAVEGMKRGAFDFVVKPWDNDKLIETLNGAYARKCDGQDKAKVKQAEQTAVEMYWGCSPAMERIHRMLEKIAPTDASVLITGENGTGKDVLAGEIHRMSERADKQMVCVDAGAITETLFESELFGHVKGAFTDAYTDRTGKIEQANGSTLFLDEIGNIPLNLQAKLLRVLQNRTVSKVGSSQSTPVDIRLICATNKDIEQMVRDGEFREDLYYRLNTGLSDDAKIVLETCRWNGNIRELQNAVEKAVIMAEGTKLKAGDFNINEVAVCDSTATADKEETLDMVEERTIRAAMDKYNGNLTHVAKALNISRPTLYMKLKKHNI